ncbi:MAG: hypothetical protein GKS05_03075 [Nitrospirales bacterium]|nr:hypothetical protein [Nitrospirales bacterium]
MSMPLTIVILITQNPKHTHRAVEGLRIALGLSTGPNPITIVLLGQAPLLLTDEVEEVIDAEIIEKHLPVIQELQLPLVVSQDATSQFDFDPGFSIQEASSDDIASLITKSDRILAF